MKLLKRFSQANVCIDKGKIIINPNRYTIEDGSEDIEIYHQDENIEIKFNKVEYRINGILGVNIDDITLVSEDSLRIHKPFFWSKPKTVIKKGWVELKKRTPTKITTTLSNLIIIE